MQKATSRSCPARVRRCLLMACGAVVSLPGCSTGGASDHPGTSESGRGEGLAPQIEAPSVLRPDGSRIIYRLDAPADVDAPYGLLFLAQGSGCQPATLEGRFSHSEKIAPGFARLSIEKYGVDPSDSDREEGDCMAAFYARDTLDQRVLDAARVLSAFRGASWWSGDLVMFGGSEGGAVVAMLAGLVPETDAVVVLSSGLGFTVEETVLAAVPPYAREVVSAQFRAARERGAPNDHFSGHSHHWWAHALNQRPVTTLLPLEVPVLVVQGGRDTSAAPESARAGVAELEGRGRCVTYHEHEALDHFMRDREGVDRRSEIYGEIANWLGAGASPTC